MDKLEIKINPIKINCPKCDGKKRILNPNDKGLPLIGLIDCDNCSGNGYTLVNSL
jgi:hypothetical protein